MGNLDLLIVSGASRGIGNRIALDLATIAKTVLAIGSSKTIIEKKFPEQQKRSSVRDRGGK
jgi:NADP-dependent 3-hydroxy acid dehydrogenase YdfG